MNAHVAQFVAAVLEGFFYQETHAHEFGTGLIYQFEYALGGIAIGQEVVDEEYLVALAQVVAAHAHIVRALLGKREYLGGKHVLHGAGGLFLGKHYRQFEQIAYHDGGGYTAGLDGDNFVDVGAGKTAYELYSH